MTPRVSRTEALLVAALLALALAVHAWLAYSGRSYLDGDECSMGVQGVDILRGARPAFFPGQHYMGCLESYALAAAYAIGAPVNGLTLRLVGGVELLLFLLGVWWLARRWFSPAAGLLALALLALPPAMPAWWLMRLRGYLPALILGNALMLVLIPMLMPGRAGRRPAMALLLGVFAGAGWWANPMFAIYIATAALAALIFGPLRRRMFFGWRQPFAALVNVAAVLFSLLLISRSLVLRKSTAESDWFFTHRAFVLILALALALGVAAAMLLRRRSNYRVAFVCGGFVCGFAPALAEYWTVPLLYTKHGMGSWDEFVQYVRLTNWYVLPDLIGLTSGKGGLSDFVQPWPLAIGLVAVYALLAYFLVRDWRALGPPARCLLLLIAVVYILAGMQGAYSWSGKRVMLPIYLPQMTLLALLLLHLWRLRRWVAVAALALILAAHFQSLRASPIVPMVWPRGLRPDEVLLLDHCRHKGWDLVALHAHNETAMRLNLNADRRIVFFDTTDGFLRIDRYRERARAARQMPLILPDDDEVSSRLDRAPDARVADWLVYDAVPVAELRASGIAPLL